MVRRQASKSRGRSRTRRARAGVKKGGKTRGNAGAFLNFVRSMRDLFPSHTPARLKHDSKAIWREMDGTDKSMYNTSRQSCGPGMMRRRSRGRRGSRRRSRSRSRSRRRSRSRSRSRRRRPA